MIYIIHCLLQAQFQLQNGNKISPIELINMPSSILFKYQTPIFTNEALKMKDLWRISEVKGNLHHSLYSDLAVAEY